MFSVPKKPWFFAVISVVCGVLLTVGSARGDERIMIKTLNMEFVQIPSGSFVMGSPPDEPFRDASETQHRVAISEPFFMQVTEVTLAQWRKIMGKEFFSRRRGTGKTPVTLVSWHDTQDFIKKLNRWVNGAYTFRLPTEAEWEYAARGGAQSPYPWGDEITCSVAMFGNNSAKGGACVAYHENRDIPVNQPGRVKRYAPNAFGLYDMHGNVWEWVQDWYGQYGSRTVTDPKGPDRGTMLSSAAAAGIDMAIPVVLPTAPSPIRPVASRQPGSDWF